MENNCFGQGMIFVLPEKYDKIETEIQLADSGYEQGQILVNPLHLASIYTSFLNEGNFHWKSGFYIHQKE